MMTVKDILRITGGILIAGSDRITIRGVSTDSRTCKRGHLFIAIKGQRYDGHRFLEQVAQKKAAAVLISRKKELLAKGMTAILIQDTLKAYGQIARFHRQKFQIPVIAVTGSNGKTTTKEMIAALISKKLRVLKSIGTHNNFIGVPETLLRLTQKHQAVVLEAGTNHPGEISYLGSICQPTVAVLTNIGESHLEFLKNKRNVFREKSALIQYLAKDGLVVYNHDDPWLNKLPGSYPLRRFSGYGLKCHSGLCVSRLEISKNHIEFLCNDNRRYRIKSVAVHNILNALAAVVCAKELGVSKTSIQRELNSFRFPSGRMRLRRKDGIWFLDDTYNANPTSFLAALKTLDAMPQEKRRVIFMGDMLELGMNATRLHRRIGKEIARLKPAVVIATGRFSRETINVIQKTQMQIQAFHFKYFNPAGRRLKSLVRKGDVVLIKGSRSFKMERTLTLWKM